MMLSRNKIIAALIPFVLTSLGIIIFLIFFYWGDITFKGPSPFSVIYNGQVHNDSAGVVTIHTQAGSQTFAVHKDHFEDQNVTQDISWYQNNSHDLHFVYKGSINETTPFAPKISYVNPIAIDDNQLNDLVTPSKERKISLPSGINQVIWNRDGTQACMLHTGSGTVQNQLLIENKGTYQAQPLDNSIFSCAAGPSNILSIGLQANNLHVGPHTLALTSNQTPTVLVSLYTNSIFVLSSESDNTTHIMHWNLDNDTHESWGNWSLNGLARIVGPDTLAIATTKGIVILESGKSVLILPNTVPINSIVATQDGSTLYYIDLDHDQSFKNIFQSDSKALFLLQQDLAADKPTVVTQLTADQSLLSARLSPDFSEAWYLFDKPTSILTKVNIAPKQ